MKNPKKLIQKSKLFNRCVKVLLIMLVMIISGLLPVNELSTLYAQTTQGELEARAAPVFRRICMGGSNAGHLCNQNGVCPGSTCPDRNIFNISVAVQFNATNAELSNIQDLISEGSAVLFDVTDGQAEIGEAFIYNNAFGTGGNADLRIYPSTSPTWWKANTGSWQVGGSMHVSINNINPAINQGGTLTHEFLHLVFDLRDEYESADAYCDGTGSESCPDAAAIAAGATPSIMDESGVDAELCWGQGDPNNLTDLSNGNHDATNVTEQSMCRSNRSGWAQVVWSWPNTFLAPTGAPDPAANGATVNPTRFILPDNTTRVVMVLDESWSMNYESPKRIERLKVAALDFIALAENNTELGIVSYSDDAETSSGRTNVAIASLGNNRSTWTNAINGISPYNMTNIGAGLEKAMDMITTAGGVTANTFIVLMTDGINNQPPPQSAADADLQAKISDLMTAGIPVYVTCTGGDLGLSSQCSEIASGTGGFYVDSQNPATLAEAFVDIHERISRRDAIGSFSTRIKAPDKKYFVEQGSESVTFTLIWEEKDVEAILYVQDPNGTQYTGTGMSHGQFVRVYNPTAGDWEMNIEWVKNKSNNYTKRAYSRNQIHSLNAAPRYATVLPGQPIYIYAYPRSNGGPITGQSKLIYGKVRLPDGSWDSFELNDMGNTFSAGDDIIYDGIYTGVYSNTTLKGPYQFLIQAEIESWHQGQDHQKYDSTILSPRFEREVRVSVAVADPNEQELTPEDDKPSPEEIPWCKWLFYVALLLLLLLLWCVIRQRRKRG